MMTNHCRRWFMLRYLSVLAFAIAVVSCSETVAPSASEVIDHESERGAMEIECEITVATGAATCDSPIRAPAGANAAIIEESRLGVRPRLYRRIYDSGTEIFQADVRLQNSLPESLGTFDGVSADGAGIRLILVRAQVTSGTGSITAVNASGRMSYRGRLKSYWQYPPQVLAKNGLSTKQRVQLNVPATVTTFNMRFVIEAEHEYLLVVNEVMANPSGFTMETTGEWFEVYNAGSFPVDLQGLMVADSSPSGRQAYHRITDSFVIAPGEYATLGQSTNTTVNGGVTIDYAYGAALALANSLDAVKISRVVGSDTVTIDRTQYSFATLSAADGISRELKNPSLDNWNMDGSNWDQASVTSLYGLGGRGTPKAQNSAFFP